MGLVERALIGWDWLVQPIGALAELVPSACSYKGPQRFGVSRDDIEADLLTTQGDIGRINLVGWPKPLLCDGLGLAERH